MLSTLDSLKREDFAIGVIAVALGVGVAQVTAQVRPPDIRGASIEHILRLTNACSCA